MLKTRSQALCLSRRFWCSAGTSSCGRSSITQVPGAEEAIRYAIIWVTFVGSSQCAKSGNHVGIDILVEALPKGCRKYVYAFSSLLACGFCVFCAWYGWSLTDMVITNNRVSAAMEMPMWILYISIPIGFGLTAIRFLIDAIQKLRQDEKPAIDKTDDGEIDISMM